jgi:hypothetical protein
MPWQPGHHYQVVLQQLRKSEPMVNNWIKSIQRTDVEVAEDNITHAVNRARGLVSVMISNRRLERRFIASSVVASLVSTMSIESEKKAMSVTLKK